MAASSRRGNDALGSLLSGFSGLEGDVMGRPKAMSDMKKKQTASKTPAPPKAQPPAATTPVDAFNVEDLEQLMHKRHASRTDSAPSISSRPSVGSALGDLDAMFSWPQAPASATQRDPSFAAPAAAAPSPQQQSAGDDDLFGLSIGGVSVPAALHVENKPARRPTLLGGFDDDDVEGADLLSGMATGPGVAATTASASVGGSMPPPLSGGTAARRPTPSSAAPPPSYDAVLPNGDHGSGWIDGDGRAVRDHDRIPSRVQSQSSGTFWAAMGGAGGGATGPEDFGDEAWPTPQRRAPAAPSNHVAQSGAFDGHHDRYADDIDNYGNNEAVSPHDHGGGFPLPKQGRAHQMTSSATSRPLSAAEVRQKAAHALRGSAAWLARGARRLQESVRELQGSVLQGSGNSGAVSGASGAAASSQDASAVPQYQLDWARAVAAQSPRTRSAMLGALGPEDRAAVQALLDASSGGVPGSRPGSRMDDDRVGRIPSAGKPRYRAAAELRGVGAGSGRLPPGTPTDALYDAYGSDKEENVETGAAPEWTVSMGERQWQEVSSPVMRATSPESGGGEELHGSQVFGGGMGEASAAGGSNNAPSREAVHQPPAHQSPPQSPMDDLLGVDELGGRAGGGLSAQTGGTTATASQAPGRASASASASADLMGFGSNDDMLGNENSAGDKHTASTAHIDAMFSLPVHSSKSTSALDRRHGGGLAATAGGAGSGNPRPASAGANARKPAHSASLGAFGDLESTLGSALPTPTDVDVSAYSDLYDAPTPGEGADEPEVRRRLRAARLAARHARMAAGLAAARAMDEAETAEREAKRGARETLAPEMEAWTAGKRDNIRALLSTMHTVLWPEAVWARPSIADMVEDAKVKRWYMKANLVVHPDKVRQKGGSPETIAQADMIFDILKAAWGKYESGRK